MALEFTHNVQKQIAVFKLSGKVMGKDESNNLLSTVDDYTFDGTTHFVLDLTKLDYINSSGLNALINVLTKSRNAGGDTILCSVNEKISKLFLITKLNTLFTITKDENDAIQTLGEKIDV